MNQVMRRSACCLLSSLLLWSCVGCTKAAHESFGDGSVQSGSENDDAAKQAYKAFTVDALDRVAVDDLNSSGKLVLVNKLGAKSVHGDDAISFTKQLMTAICIMSSPCVSRRSRLLIRLFSTKMDSHTP